MYIKITETLSKVVHRIQLDLNVIIIPELRPKLKITVNNYSCIFAKRKYGVLIRIFVCICMCVCVFPVCMFPCVY